MEGTSQIKTPRQPTTPAERLDLMDAWQSGLLHPTTTGVGRLTGPVGSNPTASAFERVRRPPGSGHST